MKYDPNMEFKLEVVQPIKTEEDEVVDVDFTEIAANLKMFLNFSKQMTSKR